jgi:hypothetical protein
MSNPMGSLADTLRGHADRRPDAIVVESDGNAVTYRQMDERSNRVANALRNAGVAGGDRIAFLDRNGPAYFEVLFAASKVNAVMVGVNFRLAPAEVAKVLNDSEARVRSSGWSSPPSSKRSRPRSRPPRRLSCWGSMRVGRPTRRGATLITMSTPECRVVPRTSCSSSTPPAPLDARRG